jgi:hypothetical protein
MDVECVSTDPACTQPHWHVLYVRTGFEPIVEICLDRRGYESYLPIAHKRRPGTAPIQAIMSLLFPGYIFCRAELTEKHEIQMIPGVIAIAAADPKTLEEEILAIRKIVESEHFYWPCPPLTAGELVQIEHGALVGLQGIFVATPQHHVNIPITVLSRAVSVAIERGAVKPVSRAKGRSV